MHIFHEIYRFIIIVIYVMAAILNPPLLINVRGAAILKPRKVIYKCSSSLCRWVILSKPSKRYWNELLKSGQKGQLSDRCVRNIPFLTSKLQNNWKITLYLASVALNQLDWTYYMHIFHNFLFVHSGHFEAAILNLRARCERFHIEKCSAWVIPYQFLMRKSLAKLLQTGVYSQAQE